MTATLPVALDELLIEALIDDGFTTLTLWVSDEQAGPYTVTAATVSPTTLALMSSTNVFKATFTYSAGTAAQWFRVVPYTGSAYAPLSNSAPFHGGGGTTLTALRRKLGRLIRDLKVGTLTTGTNTTSAVFSAADFHRFANDYFNNWILNNTTRALWSPITAWVKGASTSTATVAPAITAQVSGDTAELTRRFTPDEYREALNWAITASYPVISKTIENTALLTASNIYRFAVPNDIKRVSSVEIESQSYQTSEVEETRGFPWKDIPFDIRRDGMRQYIELDSFYTPGLRLRVRGVGPLSQVYDETNYVEEIDPQVDYICYLAAFYLFRSLGHESAATDIDRFQGLAKHYQQLAESMKGEYGEGRPAIRMWNASTRGSAGNETWGPYSRSV